MAVGLSLGFRTIFSEALFGQKYPGLNWIGATGHEKKQPGIMNMDSLG
jgi:hypothetical protein